MKDELAKIAAELLQVVRDGVQWSAALAKQELPQVVEEYLRWAFWQGIGEVVFGIIGFAVMLKLIFWARKQTCHGIYSWNKDEVQIRESSIVVIVACVAGSIAFVVMTADGLLQAAKVLIAPRVFLLGELQKLLS